MKSVLLNYFSKNKKNFIIISIMFLIGMIIGITLVNNFNESQKLELNDYINSLIENLKSDNNINKIDLLILSIKKNIFLIILICFLGCTIIGGPFIYIVILYKGFSIGYTISSMILVLGLKHGVLILLITMFLQNLIYIPTCFVVAENRYKII